MSYAHPVETEAKVGGSNPPPATNSVLGGKLELYLQEVELLRKPNTLREAKRICFAATPYIDVNDPRPGVLRFLMDRKATGIEARTLENERIRIGAFLKHAGLTITPKIPKFKFVQRKPEVYTQTELDAIFAETHGRDYWLFQTALKSGLRLQELMTLEYGNLLDSGIQVAPHGDWVPKDHEERIVKVPKSLIVALRALTPIGGSNFVFPTQTGTQNWHMLRALKRTGTRAGLNPADCWMHKFRANFCTTLLRAGMSIQDVMAQMGHSSVRSTMRYMALLEGADLQQKVEAIWG